MDDPVARIAEAIPYPVADTVDRQGKTIVLFETEGAALSADRRRTHERRHEGQDSPWTPSVRGVRPNTNICAIGTDGQLSWIVEPQVSARDCSRYVEIGTHIEPPERTDAWVRHSDGRIDRGETIGELVWARHTNGYAYVLDPENGTPVEKCSGGISTVSVGGTSQSFEYPIKTTFSIGELTVVVLDTYRFMPVSDNRTDRFYRNIVALDETGSQVWQVEGRPTTRTSGGYRDSWVEGETLYAKHELCGTVQVDPASGTLTTAGAGTRQNLLCIDAETAAVAPDRLGRVIDRETHVITRLAPDDRADDALRYQSSEAVTDLTPIPKTIVDIDGIPREQNVFAVGTDGTVRWMIDPAPGESDPHYTEIGTHLQVGDDVWATHSNGWLYRIDERDGSRLEPRSQSELHFSDRVVDLPYHVDTVLEPGETVVVLLDIHERSQPESVPDDPRLDPDELADRNVLGFDRTGRLKWVVDAVRPGRSYITIWLERGVLKFQNWGSCQGTIDPATGEILDSYFAK